MVYMRYNYRKGFMGYSRGTVKKEAKEKGKNIAVYDGNVYDFSTYIQNGGCVPAPLSPRSAPRCRRRPHRPRG